MVQPGKCHSFNDQKEGENRSKEARKTGRRSNMA
jgi:hypothetical protein